MEQLSVHTVLGLIGLIILIGLAGELFFKKTGIPSGVFLIVLGVVLGPGLGLIETETVYTLAPYFGTLALLIILFDGGLSLPLQKVLKEAPIALLFTVAVFVATMLGIAAFYVWVLEGDWVRGLLLGAILGGTTPVVVMPVVAQLDSVPEQTKVLLSLESAFGDVFVVVTALLLMDMLLGTTQPHHLVASVIHAFVDALLLAIVAGALWARLLAWLQGQTLSYMLTLAAILILYVVAELVGANGAMTILLFGLVLGNMESLVGHLARPIRQLIGYRLDQTEFALDTFLKRLNEELSFLVRTFFYVLLGLILDVQTLTSFVLAAGVAVFALALVIRWGITEAFGRFRCGWSAGERRLIVSLLPRGVAVAVMSFLPISMGIPGTQQFPVYASTVIVLSILFMTIALAMERRIETMTVPAASASSS